MKTYKYLYQKMLDENIIRRAFYKLRKGKTKRKEIKYIDEHLDDEIQNMRIMLENTKPCEVSNPELAFKPSYHKPRIINEHGKNRKIFMPEIREQWVHHIIIAVLEPIILSTAHSNACGSYPKRGAHYGKRIIEKWMSDRKNTKFLCKLDIRHFYDSISHKILFRELRNHIQDEWFLHVIKICLKQFRKGLPLGFYISQWLANYLLEPVDKMLDKLVVEHIRYMDDMVMYDRYILRLKRGFERVKGLLRHRFHLRVKDNYQLSRFVTHKGNGRPLDFMGFIFYRNKTIMRKKIMIKATRLAKKIHKIENKGYRIYKKFIAGLVSYMGWYKSTDSYMNFMKYIKPYVRVGRLKKIISVIDKRRNKNNDGMERNKNGKQARANCTNRPRLIFANTKCNLCFT